MKTRTIRTALAMLVTLATMVVLVPAAHAAGPRPSPAGRAVLVKEVDRLLQQLQKDRSALPAGLLPAHRTAVLRAYDRSLRHAGAVRSRAAAARSPQDVRNARTALQRLAHLPGTGQGLTRLLARADAGVRDDRALLQSVGALQATLDHRPAVEAQVTAALSTARARGDAAVAAHSSAATMLLRSDWSSPRTATVARVTTARPLTTGDSLLSQARASLRTAQELLEAEDEEPTDPTDPTDPAPTTPRLPTLEPGPFTLVTYEQGTCTQLADGRYKVVSSVVWSTEVLTTMTLEWELDLPLGFHAMWVTRDRELSTTTALIMADHTVEQGLIHLPEVALKLRWTDGRAGRQALAPASTIPTSQCT